MEALTTANKVGRKLLSSLMTADYENDSRDELLSKTGNWHGCWRMYCDICRWDSRATVALKASQAAFPQANSCLKARAYFACRIADDTVAVKYFIVSRR